MLFAKKSMRMYTLEYFEQDSIPSGLVFVGVEWCRFCRDLKPTWTDLYQCAVQHGLPTAVGAVDAEAIPEIKALLDIETFPTILVISDNNIQHYTGPRNLEALIDLLNDALHLKE